MPTNVIFAYSIASLTIAAFASIVVTGKVVQKWQERGPVNKLLQVVIGFFLAGLVLFALSAVFDYMSLYMYAREALVRLAPGMSTQVLTWQVVRALLITFAFALALALGWGYVTAEDMANNLVDKVAWFFLLLGIGRVAAEPILLIVQFVLQVARIAV